MTALIVEKEKTDCETVPIGSLQVLNALQKKSVPQVPTGEGQASKSEGLFYVETKLNGKPAHVLVDTGATHNFVTMVEAERFGLDVVDSGGWLKTVNTEPSLYRARFEGLKCALASGRGSWTSLSRGWMISRLCWALISYDRGTSSPMTYIRLSSMQLVEGVKGEEAKEIEDHVAAKEVRNVCKAKKGAAREAEDVLKGKENMPLSEPSREVNDVLIGEKDVVPCKFEKRQPPRMKVDCESKLDRGAKPQNVAPCGMAPPKVEKLETTSKAKREIVKLTKEGLQHDPLAKELLHLVKSGKTQRYRVKGGLLYTRDGRVYVSKWKDLRRMVI
ncbi:hypothetical protein RJ640_027375 [Escallonia rubra]|uniref:Uncharacterized protein n=1 Tax=Escallonia rubra TaxID=112253 RepID=A0AA88RU81_9ASTE|nr:hypothetical protein RJ640_027375 [Escallonia rubra]